MINKLTLLIRTKIMQAITQKDNREQVIKNITLMAFYNVHVYWTNYATLKQTATMMLIETASSSNRNL